MAINVSPTGEGLTVVLNCEYNLTHNWMAFASWYSIVKNLPDADFIIACKRTSVNKDSFSWVFRGRVKYFQYSDGEDYLNLTKFKNLLKTENIINISSSVMALRGIEDSLGPADVKLNEFHTFIDYSNGCGKLNNINNLETAPFENATKRFGLTEMSLNEVAILKLWEQLAPLYTIYI